MSKKLPIFLIFLFCCCQLATAQDDGKPKDSARMYKKIQEYSKKRKFTKFIHGLIFEPIQVKKKIAKSNARKKVRKRDFRPFEGKIIRKINVVTLDPFGYSEKDDKSGPKRY